MHKNHKKGLSYRSGSFLGAYVAMMASQPAYAQDVPAPVPEQAHATDQVIVVTAQHREQRLQDVGIAMTAYGDEQLTQLGVTSSLDIARVTPGVHVSGSFGGQSAQYTIRGVAQNDFNDVVEAPIAVYFDDGYIASLNGQVFGTFDLERVEILKGPQGTLFGRNATGGLVHFIPKKPSEATEIDANLTYGSYNNLRLEGAVGGPLGGNVSGRFSLMYNNFDAIFKNVYPVGIGPQATPSSPPSQCCENVWNDDTLAGRGQIQFESDGGLRIRLLAAASRSNVSTSPYKGFASAPVFNVDGQLIDTIYLPEGAPVLGAVPQSRKSNRISEDFAIDDLNRSRNYAASLHLDHSFGDVEFTAITDWKQLKKYFVTTVDGSPVNFVEFASAGNMQQFSQELRFAGFSDSLQWTAGAYFLDIDARSSNGFLAPSGSAFAASLGFGGPGVDLVNRLRLRTQSVSGFGQFEWQFAPEFTAIVGGRLIHEKQKFDYRQSLVRNDRDLYIDSVDIAQLPAFADSNGTPQVTPFADENSDTLWAGKFQLEYRPVDDLLIYAGISRGVKGGAFNAKLPDGTPPLRSAEIPYGPETLISYEGGLKSMFFDGAITFNAAAYYYDYSDYQAFLFTNASGLVSNRDARTYGIEFNLGLRPTSRLEINAAAAFNDPKVKRIQTAAATTTASAVLRDVEPAFAPKTQLSLMASWNLPVLNDALTLSANGSYTGRYFHNIRNFTSNRIPGYFLSNARIAWESPNKAWLLAASVDNIFDKRVNTIGFDLTTFCGCSLESYNKPRWWSISVGFKY